MDKLYYWSKLENWNSCEWKLVGLTCYKIIACSDNEKVEKTTSCDKEDFLQRARSLLVVVPSPPVQTYETFSNSVRLYNTQPPFNFPAYPDVFAKKSWSKVNPIFVKQHLIQISFEQLGAHAQLLGSLSHSSIQ